MPGRASKSYLDDLNPDSMKAIAAFLEPGLAGARDGDRFQFERHGYFVRRDDGSFIRTCTLRDSWGTGK